MEDWLEIVIREAKFLTGDGRYNICTAPEFYGVHYGYVI